jgi:glycosyltransferase involved in cell wall biosynthesis
MKNKKILIGMPAYNEAKVIGKVIENIKKNGFENILVVDDCSADNTSLIAKKNKAIVLRHPINRGAGAATGTIIEYAKREKYDLLVLIDADGQHSPKEIKKLLKESNKYDVVIGSRLIGSDLSEMPISRRILNFGGSLITYFVFGTFVKDSQSGFKVLNKKAIENIQITFDRYEFCSEIIGEIHKNKLTFKEIPIKVIYTEHSLGKETHGQSFFNSFKMIIRLIMRI